MATHMFCESQRQFSESHFHFSANGNFGFSCAQFLSFKLEPKIIWKAFPIPPYCLIQYPGLNSIKFGKTTINHNSLSPY